MTRLLLLEDSPTQAEQLRIILEAAGFETTSAPDGEKGLALLRRSSFDLVISDVLMPRMSGYELCRQLKADPLRRSIPVILLTTLSDPMDIIEGLECGADNFVTKPYEPEHLVARVRTILENRRLRGEAPRKAGVGVVFLGREFTITSDKEQILDLLIATFEDTVRTSRELHAREADLAAAKSKIEEYARRLERKARLSEEKYRTLMEHANDAIFITDPHGRVLETNRQADELLGRPPEEIVGHAYDEFVVAAERDYSSLLFQRLLTEGSTKVSDLHLIRPDGMLVCADLSASLVSTDGEQIALAIVHDVSERNRLQRQLLQNEKLATVGTLSAGVAHEINNPTAALLANLESIDGHFGRVKTMVGSLAEVVREAEGDLKRRLEQVLATGLVERATSELEEDLGDCKHAAERIRDIVRDLKTFSHIDDGDVSMVSINERLQTTIRMALGEIRYRARVETDFASDLPRIVASPGKLNQLFLNLIINGAQAIEEGRVERNRILVRTQLQGGAIRIDIVDTGKGIPREILPRIFDPFFTTKPVGVGTGLGLSICHDIVKKHSGEIRVESEVGRGTRFTVLLPRDTGLTLPRKAAVMAMPPTGRLHILVVDDESALLRALQRTLGSRHEVTTALGGRAAIELLGGGADSGFDIVFCDLMMPDVNGADLHRFLTERDPALASRMVFITGGAFTPHARSFLARIDNPRLEKPFELEDADRVIAALMQKQLKAGGA